MTAVVRGFVAALLALAPLFAFAQESWPSRPITIVVPYAPGGVTDAIARVIAPELGASLGQTVIVENRAGGNGLIGTDFVASAKPDGYTLVMMIDANTIAPSLYPKLNHDPLKSFAPITLLAKAQQIIVAHPSFAPNDLKSLIETAKAAPTPIFYASAGNGTSHHLGMEQLKMLTGMKLQHVPYKGGGQAIVDLLSGQVKVGIIGIAPALPHVKAGKLKAIAVTGRQRSPVLPDVPTVQEQGVAGFESFNWFGLLAPAGTPQAIIARLHDATLKVMTNPALVQRFAAMPVEVSTSAAPADFARFLAEDVAKWPPIVRAANVKPD
ncbi:MAG TPA: tripartite tricarboxylate transporter substrate binding protein [Ramlibacter sp.]|uniref:tripartite tricarboxylate transporter substrate binding protein n=1 Tax=Ramlibacter sp. TaxID=1917967 RepID=UPI002CFF0AEA|nr:tripartite tricarboxylate transporter substrate binding protein [Ramlibacter sp.]HVZ42344.1 tripartite tricarboxylate transporter substrate binding protein [Ramlibacter sp.]